MRERKPASFAFSMPMVQYGSLLTPLSPHYLKAKVLGAFKLARFAYERLQRQRVPPRWQDQIDLDMLNVQAKPVRDSPELFAACFRCGASNPLLSPSTPMPSSSSSISMSTPYGGSGSASGNSSSLCGRRRLRSGGWSAWGDSCTTCRHPFIRSFINFESLPLVEFQPEPGISDEEALEMIRADPKHVQKMDWRSRKRSEHWRQAKEGEADVMMNTDEDDDTGDVDDRQDRDGEDVGGDELFNQCINAALEAQEESCEYVRVAVPAACLQRIRRQDVFHVPLGTYRCGGSFYKNMMPEIPLALSQPCGRFFHEEDFEFAYLKQGRCPFSRLEDVGDYGSC